jgi:ABC-type amino acid transport system permease subunit
VHDLCRGVPQHSAAAGHLLLVSGVLAVLPQPRESLHLPFGMFLNNRGLAFPKAIFGTGMLAV